MSEHRCDCNLIGIAFEVKLVQLREVFIFISAVDATFRVPRRRDNRLRSRGTDLDDGAQFLDLPLARLRTYDFEYVVRALLAGAPVNEGFREDVLSDPDRLLHVQIDVRGMVGGIAPERTDVISGLKCTVF